MDKVLPGETLSELSARLRRPGCMILRANGLLSPGWLLPGREIVVPEPDYCMRAEQEYICPRDAVQLAAVELSADGNEHDSKL